MINTSNTPRYWHSRLFIITLVGPHSAFLASSISESLGSNLPERSAWGKRAPVWARGPRCSAIFLKHKTSIYYNNNNNVKNTNNGVGGKHCYWVRCNLRRRSRFCGKSLACDIGPVQCVGVHLVKVSCATWEVLTSSLCPFFFVGILHTPSYGPKILHIRTQKVFLSKQSAWSRNYWDFGACDTPICVNLSR